MRADGPGGSAQSSTTGMTVTQSGQDDSDNPAPRPEGSPETTPATTDVFSCLCRTVNQSPQGAGAGSSSGPVHGPRPLGCWVQKKDNNPKSSKWRGLQQLALNLSSQMLRAVHFYSLFGSEGEMLSEHNPNVLFPSITCF